MAACTAVISLLQTLEQRNPKLFPGNTTKTLDFLHATAEYFQKVLENASKSRFDTEKIKSLEEKIRVAASYAEDVVEMKISRIIKVLGWTFGILQHLDLLKVVEKMDTTKKQVMDILSHDADQVFELSGDSLIGTFSTSYPILSDQLEDDIVHGLDDDLEIIINRLKGRLRDLDIVTVSGMGGIGKTTLARKAYNHLTIRYHFDILVRVTISQEFRCRNVLLEALHCISKQTDMVNTKSPYLPDPIKRFVFPTSLKRLSLSRCKRFLWEDISSTLKMLPNLEELKLKHYHAMGGVWRLSDEEEFKSLKLLLLTGPSLKRLEASSDNFPNLKRLVLKDCCYLQEIPADFGTFESIELHDCSDPAEDSARNIMQEQEDMGNNLLKVYIYRQLLFEHEE